MGASLSRAKKTTSVVIPGRFKANRESQVTLDLRKRPRSIALPCILPNNSQYGRNLSTAAHSGIRYIYVASGNCQQRYTVPKPKRFGRTLQLYSAVTLCPSQDLSRELPVLSIAVHSCFCMVVRFSVCAAKKVQSLQSRAGADGRSCHRTVVFLLHSIVRFLNSGTPRTSRTSAGRGFRIIHTKMP